MDQDYLSVLMTDARQGEWVRRLVLVLNLKTSVLPKILEFIGANHTDTLGNSRILQRNILTIFLVFNTPLKH